jgi:hypothetical protein
MHLKCAKEIVPALSKGAARLHRGSVPGRRPAPARRHRSLGPSGPGGGLGFRQGGERQCARTARRASPLSPQALVTATAAGRDAPRSCGRREGRVVDWKGGRIFEKALRDLNRRVKV